MNNRHICFLIIFLCAVAVPMSAISRTVVVQLAASDVSVSASDDRGPYFVFELKMPEELVGKRLDAVILEFYVDVDADPSIEGAYTPSIEVFPLTEPVRNDRAPIFDRQYPTSLPVLIGDAQRVSMDITTIVKKWLADPQSNYGLVLGSFAGPKVGGLALNSDVLGDRESIKVTFYYQNRFGERVSGR